MEVFQNLKIFLSPEDFSEFKEKLVENISSTGWVHKEDFETNYKKNTGSKDSFVICIETPKLMFENKNLQAFIWLREDKDLLEVFNILPAVSGSLSYKQYNFILNKFYNLFVSDLSKKMDLKVEMSKPEKSITDIIGKDASEALLRFSNSANKSTGNTHPYDFNRWCEFVFIIHRKKIPLNIQDFERWLIEEGWSDRMAGRLGTDLEYALSILEKYEQY